MCIRDSLHLANGRANRGYANIRRIKRALKRSSFVRIQVEYAISSHRTQLEKAHVHRAQRINLQLRIRTYFIGEPGSTTPT